MAYHNIDDASLGSQLRCPVFDRLNPDPWWKIERILPRRAWDVRISVTCFVTI